MAQKPELKKRNVKQSKMFIETARKYEVDESAERFERTIRSIVPPKRPKTKRNSKKS